MGFDEEEVDEVEWPAAGAVVPVVLAVPAVVPVVPAAVVLVPVEPAAGFLKTPASDMVADFCVVCVVCESVSSLWWCFQGLGEYGVELGGCEFVDRGRREAEGILEVGDGGGLFMEAERMEGVTSSFSNA